MSVKSTDITGLSSTNPATISGVTVNDGDKLMVWDSVGGMVPYGALTISGTGNSQPTPTPTTAVEPSGSPSPSPTATAETTGSPSPSPTATAAATGTPTPSPSPTPSPTPAPTHAVTVNVTPENAGTVKVEAGTTELNAEALATVAEGTKLTITAAPNTGYLANPTITVVTTATAESDNPTAIAANDDGTYTMPTEDITITATFEVDTALYRLNATGLTSGQITYSLTEDDLDDISNVTADEAALSDVADFGTGTDKTAAISALDGWGYKHFAHTSQEKNGAFTSRQSTVTLDAAANKLTLKNSGQNTADSSLAFIPANCATITLPTSGTLVYTFDIDRAHGNSDKSKTIIGLTTATDGSAAAAASIASAELTGTDTDGAHTAVITYSVDKKNYTISIDGEEVARGTAETAATGIYIQNTNAEASSSISNLVITTEENAPIITVTAPAETDGTLTVTPASGVKKGDEITIKAAAVAGRKVTAVKVNGTALTEANADGSYTYTVNDDVTITAEFDRADIDSIEISGDETVARTTNNTYTLTAKAADGTVLTLTDTEKTALTWTIENAATGAPESIDTDTTITKDAEDATKAVLAVTATQAAGNIVVKAAIGEVNGTKAVAITDQTVYTITAATDLTGGTVKVDKTTAVKGTKITVTVTPDKGYQLKANSLKYNVDENNTEITATEGVYSFNVPEATATTITVTAEFEKADYEIKNATATTGANGSITVAETAQMDDEVAITVTPDEDYELYTLTVEPTTEGSETIITVSDGTDENEGKKVFTMPAEPVTVTATFRTKPLADRLPASYDTASLTTVYANSTQTLRDGDKSYTVPETGNTASVNSSLLTAAQQNVYTSFDLKLASGDGLTITQDNGSSNQGTTLIFTTGTELKAETTHSNSAGAKQETTYTLLADTWYNVVVTTPASTSATGNASIAIYALNSDDTVGETAVLTNTALDPRNIGAKAFNTLKMRSVTGSPKIDNAYIYTDPYYSATITVNTGDEGNETAIDGATVTVKKDGVTVATGMTTEEGTYTIDKIQAGTYTVAVTATGYVPITDRTLTVAKDGQNTTSITMTVQPQTLASVGISGGIENQTVLTTTATGGKQVATLTATAYNESGTALDNQPNITWTSSSENTTVNNGVVTVTSSQTAGTVTITASATQGEGDSAVTKEATYTITVADYGTETILAATDDFEGDTSIFTVTSPAAVDLIKTGSTNHVMKLNGTDSAVSLTLDAPIAAGTNETVELSYNAYHGWVASSESGTTTWTIKNDSDQTVLSYTVNGTGPNVTAVTVAGVEQTVTAFNFQPGSKQNTWDQFTENATKVTLTIAANGDVTAVFTLNDNTTETFKVEATDSQLTTTNIKSFNVANTITQLPDRTGGFDNFKTVVTRTDPTATE